MERIRPTTSDELVEDVQVLFLLLLRVGGASGFKLVELVRELLIVLLAVPVHLLVRVSWSSEHFTLSCNEQSFIASVDLDGMTDFNLHLFA